MDNPSCVQFCETASLKHDLCKPIGTNDGERLYTSKLINLVHRCYIVTPAVGCARLMKLLFVIINLCHTEILYSHGRCYIYDRHDPTAYLDKDCLFLVNNDIWLLVLQCGCGRNSRNAWSPCSMLYIVSWFVIWVPLGSTATSCVLFILRHWELKRVHIGTIVVDVCNAHTLTQRAFSVPIRHDQFLEALTN